MLKASLTDIALWPRGRSNSEPCQTALGRVLGFAMQRWLILFGVILIVAGLAWPLLVKSGLGRLPGDIVIERGNFRLYLPLATSLVISLLLSVFLWIINR